MAKSVPGRITNVLRFISISHIFAIQWKCIPFYAIYCHFAHLMPIFATWQGKLFVSEKKNIPANEEVGLRVNDDGLEERQKGT